MLEIAHTWTSTGSTGTWNTPVFLDVPPTDLALFVQCSTIATTNSFELQSALSSGGPWLTEGSTAVAATATVSALSVLRLAGAIGGWVRPVTKTASTGDYTIKLVGIR